MSHWAFLYVVRWVENTHKVVFSFFFFYGQEFVLAYTYFDYSFHRFGQRQVIHVETKKFKRDFSLASSIIELSEFQ